MKRQRRAIFFFVVISVVFIGVLCIIRFGHKKPFSDLTVSEIRSVELYGPSGTKTVCELSEDEKTVFVELLNTIVISNTGNYEYQRWSGSKSEMFLITWNNGDQTVVASSNPYFVLNGKGYACEDKQTLAALSDLYAQHFR